MIASKVDWRFAFFAVGLAGLALAPIFRLAIREPPRGRYDPPRAHRPAPGITGVFHTLSSKPSFWLMSLAAACSSMMGYGLFFWLPSFFVRSYGLELLEASFFFGAIVLLGGLAGIWAGGWFGDRIGQVRRRRYPLIPAVALFAIVPFYLVALFSPNLTLTFVVLLVPTALGLTWLGPVVASIQHLVPPDMRATASAVFLFINNLIGLGLGTWVLGALSDSLAVHYGDDSLRYSILAGSVLYVVAAVLFALASRWIEADWED